jgi:hypothetical protein
MSEGIIRMAAVGCWLLAVERHLNPRVNRAGVKFEYKEVLCLNYTQTRLRSYVLGRNYAIRRKELQ